MAVRVLILGNSGAGKSTLARQLAASHGLAGLDLDRLVWVPGEIAKPRAASDIEQDLQRYLGAHPEWVIEGCYSEWIRYLAPFATHLVFLNPGVAACLANNQRRPYEPHKYASPADQDAMFEALQQWVSTYPSRDDAWSLSAHRQVFADFPGPKLEITAQADGAALAVFLKGVT